MNNTNVVKKLSRLIAILVGIALAVTTVPSLHAADDDFDSYKIRFSVAWFYAGPSGTLQGASDAASIDIQKDLSINNYYSTFSGKVDWKFTRKNHLYFVASPFDKRARPCFPGPLRSKGRLSWRD